MRRYHKDRTLPYTNQIFVFGSNYGGHHGAGAAKLALDKYGAVWGQSEGLHGKSYALPTVGHRLARISFDSVSNNIIRFLEFAKNNPQLDFFVTRVGCVLAKHKESEIVKVFYPYRDLANLDFPENWKSYLDKD
jgi:hypothetical protein